jgi:branched-chain amino acid transport system substrate-binding protein
VDRRRFLALAGVAGAAGGLSALGAGCARRQVAASDDPPVRFGYVSPQSGPLAAFGEADNYVIASLRRHFQSGLVIGGRRHRVDILTKDSQSDGRRAATVARNLIAEGQVDLMLVASTPDTTNPVADVCEGAGIPCISTGAAWQPWWHGRKGDKAKPFAWTWHFFSGLEDGVGTYLDMWGQLSTNKVVGALWPNDADGLSAADPEYGFPPALAAKGFRLVDPGRYTSLTDDFRPQIDKFKKERAEILTGVPQPPDFATFWKQAAELDYRPKIVTVGKALLFPAFVDAMVPSAEGVGSEVWWSPGHPFRSSLTGESPAQLAADYIAHTGKQWTQPIGVVHALFEVAANVMGRAPAPGNREAVADAIAATNLDTIVGRVAWGAAPPGLNPVPNVAKTPLVGGQWRRGEQFPFDLVVVSNARAKQIATAGRLQPIPSV